MLGPDRIYRRKSPAAEPPTHPVRTGPGPRGAATAVAHLRLRTDQARQGKVSSAKTKRGCVGETARARGYLRPRAAGYFYIAILARAAARGRRPEGCEAGSYRQNGPFGPLPKPKFGRGDGRLGDRPAVAPSGWRETAVPMRVFTSPIETSNSPPWSASWG